MSTWIEGVEYDVVFNGTHANSDRDLLCCRPDAVKRPHVVQPAILAAPQPRVDGLAVDVVASLLAYEEAHALRTRDLMALSGLSLPTVNTGLYQLRRRGVLRSKHDAPTGQRGRGRLRYWLVMAGQSFTRDEA